MRNDNFDPMGFVWGLQVGGTEDDPVYSFYTFEECGHGYWSVAYLSEWRPADDTFSHKEPLYHSTIDAGDGNYYGHGDGTGNVGFADGTIFGHGTLPDDIKLSGITMLAQHTVRIENTSAEINELSVVSAVVETKDMGGSVFIIYIMMMFISMGIMGAGRKRIHKR